MPKPLSASLIICERALQEKDDVISAIRIVDLFLVALVPDIPPDKQAVSMTLVVSCQFANDDESTHSLAIRLLRPDGSDKEVELEKPLEINLASFPLRTPDSTRGIQLVAPWGVKPTHMGRHRVSLLIDGEVVASRWFILAPRPIPAKE